MKIFAGNGCTELAYYVSKRLHEDLADATLTRFNDGEIRFEIMEHVRGEDVFIVQSTGRPCNDNIMELAIMADGIKRSAAERIVAVIPYYGYSRQDRRPEHARTPITSRLVADLLQAAGINYVVTVDIHSEQQQGFFNVPFINLSASEVLIADIKDRYPSTDPVWHRHSCSNDIVIVSPDAGGVARARAIAKQLDDAPIAIIDKRRPAPGVSEVHHIVGDVEDKTCIMIDDMVDTAGTLCHAAAALKERGANRVVAYVTHPVLSGNAINNIRASVFDELVVTDTIPLSMEAEAFASATGKIRTVTISRMLAEAIRRIHTNQSIRAMYT